MRRIKIADGRGVVEVRGRRAVVRIHGCYVGQAVKCGGRWALPGEPPAYRGPAEAAEALAEEDAYGQAA